MTLDDSWWLFMTLDDTWWHLMTLDDSWWCLMTPNNKHKMAYSCNAFTTGCPKKKLSLGFETILSVLVSWKYLRGHNSISTVGGTLSCDKHDHLPFSANFWDSRVFSARVRTNTKFSNEPSTEYVFENQICTNRILSNYSFRKNYLSTKNYSNS